MMRLSSRTGEVHKVKILKREYKGTYASVWFSEPVPRAKRNTELQYAPAYYVEFTWEPFLEQKEAKLLLDDWVSDNGLREKLALWRSTYHIKYFYNCYVETEKGRGWMEVWWEANWDGKNRKLRIEGRPPGKNETVISGFPVYKFLPFRIIGIRAVHPFGFHVIVLRSDFVHQYKVLGGGEVWTG